VEVQSCFSGSPGVVHSVGVFLDAGPLGWRVDVGEFGISHGSLEDVHTV
jgi:hypothetical protein